MMMITTADGIQRIPRALALNSVNVRGDIARAGSSASTGLGATAVPDQILVTAELPRPHHDGSLVMMLMVDRRPDGPLLLRNFRVFGLKDEFFQVILELHAMLRTNTAVGVVGRVISLTRQRGCPGFVRHRRRRRYRRRDGTEGRRGGRNGGRHFSPGHGAPTLEGGAWGVFPWRDGGGQIIFAAGGRSRSRRGRGPNVFLGLSAPWRDGSHDAWGRGVTTRTRRRGGRGGGREKIGGGGGKTAEMRGGREVTESFFTQGLPTWLQILSAKRRKRIRRWSEGWEIEVLNSGEEQRIKSHPKRRIFWLYFQGIFGANISGGE